MKRLIVKPLMIRVNALIHMWQVSISKLDSIAEVTAMTNLKMTLKAKQDAISEVVGATVFSWLPVVRLPTPVCAFGSVGSADALATSGTPPSLAFPSLLYSVGRKGHSSTSRVEVSNPRVKNGWVRNEDMWVLMRDGKSYNIAVMPVPLGKGYRIFKGSRLFGVSRTLEAAKRRAEKIKTPRQPFK